MVDAVVRHWLLLATKEAERRGERGREGRHQAALFYADDGMIASSDPRWLQWAFTILVGLFDRVGMKTNQSKTVSMTCRPCSAYSGGLNDQNMVNMSPIKYYQQQKTQEDITYITYLDHWKNQLHQP